ncbi:hypothetical protein J5N97_014657 [Dioscorea zingiberensis]|uniref:UBC core domain-containing protein n=1 Tax=Dioscorea zingiberensis TaxID=325984 RepID=A0A9D5CTV4_9LILI|nr:hypothetical protein J5N97_014657 [Dioscorea zingiberensis]
MISGAQEKRRPMATIHELVEADDLDGVRSKLEENPSLLNGQSRFWDFDLVLLAIYDSFCLLFLVQLKWSCKKLLMASNTERILKELHILENDPYTSHIVGPLGDDLSHWTAAILGPSNTPYTGGLFYLNIHFPQDFPAKPPKISFKTEVFHLNINSNGNIALDILGEQWTPDLTISKVLRSISALLAEPNLECCVAPEMAQMYVSDRAEYQKTARAWTQKHAAR